MRHKQKLLLKISIAFNIILIAIVAWGIVNLYFVNEQVLLTEVQYNLVELEGLIANQSEKNWPEPNLVTTKLGDVLNGILLGKTTGEQLGILSENDEKILTNLYTKLNRYPNDELYSFIEVSEEGKKNFEELREVLREAGLGLNISISASYGFFYEASKGNRRECQSSNRLINAQEQKKQWISWQPEIHCFFITNLCLIPKIESYNY
ncbi:hypothetical protein [Bacillus sp. EB01]|uniref:hypothetical protein n=1 Tax=Bacillus sp. EB01 TaxID=1347086 RepID=UPI000A9F89AA|nr:hypothetical protein [Bacillus sp. EB01]